MPATKRYSWKDLCDKYNKDRPKKQIVYEFAGGHRVFTLPDNETGHGVYPSDSQQGGGQ